MKKNKTKVKKANRRREKSKKSDNQKSYHPMSSNCSRFSVSFGAVTILVVDGSCDRHRSTAEPQYRITILAQNKLRIKKRKFTLIA
jgi:hypothetical protein